MTYPGLGLSDIFLDLRVLISLLNRSWGMEPSVSWRPTRYEDSVSSLPLNLFIFWWMTIQTVTFPLNKYHCNIYTNKYN